MLPCECIFHLCRLKHPNVHEQLSLQEYHSEDELLILRHGRRRNFRLLALPLKDAFDASFAGGDNHERRVGDGFCHSDANSNDHNEYVAD